MLAAGGLLVAALAGLGLVLGTASRGADAPVERLPDLVQRAPYRLTGQTVVVGGRPRFRLAFASAVDNAGQGPLLITARRLTHRDPVMTADQIVTRSDGSTRVRRRVGIVRYTRAADHEHWHLLRFDRYQLRRARTGSVVQRDRKTGFCLGDRYESSRDELPHEPEEAVLTGECGRRQPGLLSVREGISVGYGDDYPPLLEGQYLDITGLPAGRYELVHAVNGDRRIAETSYRNNAASIVIELTWPRGMRQNPKIDVLRRCGDGRRCLPR